MLNDNSELSHGHGMPAAARITPDLIERHIAMARARRNQWIVDRLRRHSTDIALSFTAARREAASILREGRAALRAR